MEAWMWLILVLAVVILAPLVPRILRKIDSERQLRGNIPERKAPENLNTNTPHPGDGSTADGEILAGQARMKSGQNAMSGLH